MGHSALQVPEEKGHLWGRFSGLEGEALSPAQEPGMPPAADGDLGSLGPGWKGVSEGKPSPALTLASFPALPFSFRPPVPQTAAQQRQTFQVPQLPPCVHGCRLVGGTPGYAHSETRQGLHLLHLQPGLHLGECLLPWGGAEVDTRPRE